MDLPSQPAVIVEALRSARLSAKVAYSGTGKAEGFSAAAQAKGENDGRSVGVVELKQKGIDDQRLSTTVLSLCVSRTK
jgi:hypothetical protein